MSILTIVAILAFSAGVVYVLMKTGKIEDKDGNNIPDVVDNKVKETKARVKRVKEEVADVVEAVKEVANQSKDIVDAAKGEKRKGKKSSK